MRGDEALSLRSSESKDTFSWGGGGHELVSHTNAGVRGGRKVTDPLSDPGSFERRGFARRSIVPGLRED